MYLSVPSLMYSCELDEGEQAVPLEFLRLYVSHTLLWLVPCSDSSSQPSTVLRNLLEDVQLTVPYLRHKAGSTARATVALRKMVELVSALPRVQHWRSLLAGRVNMLLLGPQAGSSASEPWPAALTPAYQTQHFQFMNLTLSQASPSLSSNDYIKEDMKTQDELDDSMRGVPV
ncbi:hypothetical protein NDU88_011330 [Pleurodeles waltl]|uniref:Uncharacterized protein n=1 Tax=Pleurodeles waltl TaxID=8319 RepID=A0AAV7R2R4_PLEWA|nr:hypothetical protein NDU88_011330 [Pleurodeles waltl]